MPQINEPRFLVIRRWSDKFLFIIYWHNQECSTLNGVLEVCNNAVVTMLTLEQILRLYHTIQRWISYSDNLGFPNDVEIEIPMPLPSHTQYLTTTVANFKIICNSIESLLPNPWLDEILS